MKTSLLTLIMRIPVLLYVLFMSVILLLNICLANVDYACKKEFLFPNFFLVLILLTVFGCSAKIYSRRHIKIKLDIRVLSLILLAVRIYVSYNIYFTTNSWDVSTVINNARYIESNTPEYLDHYYFSIYPNNQFIVLVYALIFRLNSLFGVFDTDNGLMFIIAIQCLLSTLTGYLLFEIIKNYTNNETTAYTGWLFFVGLIGCSGWNVVTYSDASSLIFPVLILRIYQHLQNGRYQYFKWGSLCFLSYWGYKLKPSVLIILIAIIISEIFYTRLEIAKQNVKKLIIFVFILIANVMICSCIFTKLVTLSGLQIDREANFGPLHMVMMGLNPENHGCWNGPDMEFSSSFSTRDERTAAQIKMIQQRLMDYRWVGGLKHCIKKSLMNFNDGSFAWGFEGGFYDVIYENKNSLASPVLKNIFYNDGKYYPILLTIEQALWLFTLVMSLFAFHLKSGKQTAVIPLSLVGIILFVMIFEARARYLYVYAPYFIIAGAIGIQNIYKRYIRRNPVYLESVEFGGDNI